jgi:3-oxoacyl-[acyl-carrier protein] reductase
MMRYAAEKENRMPEDAMKGMVALVTGGAGGIGAAMCLKLAEAGARVVLTGRDTAKLKAAVGALPGDGHWATAVSVTDSTGLADLADQVEKRYGRLDVLVNNAAITKWVAHDDLDGLDDDFIDEMFRVNWRGAYACARAFHRLLAEGDGGVIINITSQSGITGQGSNIAYCATKAGLNALTVSLARAFAPKLRVVALSPGFVDTGFVTRDAEWVKAAAAGSVMKTAVPPEALGDAVVAIVTKMPYSTGCYIPVDGGKI